MEINWVEVLWIIALILSTAYVAYQYGRAHGLKEGLDIYYGKPRD